MTADPYKVWAVLRYGWESKKFYRDWFGGDNELAQNMPGAFIDPIMSPINAISKEFLELFTGIIRDDKRYAKRIETHYQLFKEKIQDKQNNQLPIRRTDKKTGMK
jgi:hypothetical protein